MPPTLAAGDQGRQQRWLELVVCTPSAAGACAVAGAGGQTHTCSGGGQSRQKRLEPATGVLAAAGALAIMMQALTAASHHCCSAVVASYGDQARDPQCMAGRASSASSDRSQGLLQAHKCTCLFSRGVWQSVCSPMAGQCPLGHMHSSGGQ